MSVLDLMLAAVFVAGPRPTCPATALADDELQSVRRCLHEFELALANVHTCVCEQNTGFVTAAPDWLSMAWPGGAERTRALAWTTVGIKKSLRIYHDADEVPPATNGRDADWLMIWTGEEFYVSDTERGQSRHAYLPQPGAFGTDVGYVTVFNGATGWPSFMGPFVMSTFVKPSLFLESHKSDDRLTMLFRTGENSTTATIEFVFVRSPRLRLLAVTLDISSVDAETGAVTPFGRKMFRVDKWVLFEGVEVPSVATCIEGRVSGDGSGVVKDVIMRRIERRSIERLSDGAQSAAKYFEPRQFRDGDAVVDQCNGLTYEIGDHTLFVDHVQIILDEPIQGRISDDLPDIAGKVEKVRKGIYRKSGGSGG